MPAGVIQASPLATPTSSPVSPARCVCTASMSPVPGQSDSPGRCLGVHGWGESACWRLGRKGMSEEGAPLPTRPLLAPRPPRKLGTRAPAWPRMAPVLSQALSACLLSLSPPYPTPGLPLPPKRAPGSGRRGCGGLAAPQGPALGRVFPDTCRMITCYTEPFKADKTPNGENPFKSMMIATLICNSK